MDKRFPQGFRRFLGNCGLAAFAFFAWFDSASSTETNRTEKTMRSSSEIRSSKPKLGPAGLTANDENSTGNYTALSSGSITSATGTISAIFDVTQAKGFGFTNNFSIQLNSNGFPSPFCKFSHNANCVGSEQFVVDSGGGINIQVWLNNFFDNMTTKCPDTTWNIASGTVGKVNVNFACWKRVAKSDVNVDYPVHTFNQLNYISITATAATDGEDTLAVTLLGKSLPSIQIPANFKSGLFGNWRLVDFNVYGESNNEVIFNPGATMSIGVNVTDGAANPPTCSGQGLGGVSTAETSNLTLARCVSTPQFGQLLAHGIAFVQGVPPTVTKITPQGGVASGGTLVTISGTGLTNGMTVKFGNAFAPGSTRCKSDLSSCTILSPPGSGKVDITVVNVASPEGIEGIFSSQNISVDGFQYK